MPDLPGVRHRYETVRGARLHVAEAGEGPPLILLHGWPQHWWEWRGLIGPLAERRRVICPDMRGFGWSEATAGGYLKESLASDVLALADALGVDEFELGGHDWGGFVGFLLCLRAPQRVKRYLAMNVAPPPMRPPSARMVAGVWRFWYQWVISAPLLGQWLVSRMPRAARSLERTPTMPWDEVDREIFLGQFREPARARASVLVYRNFVLRETPALSLGRYHGRKLSTPTLLLYGTGDAVVRPELFAGWEDYAEDMSVEFVEDCGHFIADERPELVADRALEFFGP